MHVPFDSVYSLAQNINKISKLHNPFPLMKKFCFTLNIKNNLSSSLNSSICSVAFLLESLSGIEKNNGLYP